MAQVNDQRPLAASAKNLAVALNSTGLTTLIEMVIPEPARRLGVSILPTVENLNGLLVEAKFYRDAPYVTVSNALATTSTAPFMGVSATLATLTAGSTGWFFMDVSGVYGVRVSAQAAAGTDGLCDAYASANS